MSTVSGAVRLHFAEAGTRTRRGWTRVAVGRDVEVDYAAIQRTFPSALSGIDCDLLLVVGAVQFADRRCRRTLCDGWARDLEIIVPVSEPELWSSNRVNDSLHDCLRYVTGDRWRIQFVRRSKQPPVQQDLLADGSRFEEISAVVPYSGGLDSVAGVQVLKASRSMSAVLLAGSESNPDVGQLIRRTSNGWHQDKDPVCVRIGLHPGPRTEPTYRGRTFRYFSAAALAAKLVNATEVVVMENGQGAIGPSLIPVHREFPYRASYPGFTLRLARFLSSLWPDYVPQFSHPHLWQTKAELLAAAAAVDDPCRWTSTVSCASNLRRQRGAGTPRLCGICGGCMLRAVALRSAGFNDIDNTADFVFRDLTARTLSGAAGDASASGASKSEHALALASALNMTHLARLSDSTSSDPGVLRVADELSTALGIELADAHARLGRLVRRHADEWWGFVDSLGSNSWLAGLVARDA